MRTGWEVTWVKGVETGFLKVGRKEVRVGVERELFRRRKSCEVRCKSIYARRFKRRELHHAFLLARRDGSVRVGGRAKRL